MTKDDASNYYTAEGRIEWQQVQVKKQEQTIYMI